MTQLLLFGDSDLPTSTVHQARLQMFQATRRPTMKTRPIRTPWGSGEIIGKTGQGHADVLESVFRCAYKNRRDNNPSSPTFGAIEILVDPAEVRKKAASKSNGKLSYQQLNILLDDLMQVVISLSGDAINPMRKGHIIDEVIESKIEAPTLNKGTIKGKNGKRYYWYVRISATFAKFIENDLHLYYDPEPIAQLNSGIAQAVARHVSTHKTQPAGGWKIDEMIKAVGAGDTSAEMKNRRRELRHDAEGLKALGITLDGERLKRQKT